MQQKIDKAVSILREANKNDAGILFTGGKDSMVILDLWLCHLETEPELLVIDTYNQFDEIYDFRKRIAEEWGLDLVVRSNQEFLENVIWNENDERDFAWNGPKTEGCCGALKIDVIAKFVSEGYSPFVVGRREADVNGSLSHFESKREPVPHDRYHPLAKWSDSHIRAYLTVNDVPLPSLYEQGYEHTDCVDCTVAGEEGDDWSGVSEDKREQLNNLRDMGYM